LKAKTTNSFFALPLIFRQHNQAEHTSNINCNCEEKAFILRGQ
jgi:hypothetical protein